MPFKSPENAIQDSVAIPQGRRGFAEITSLGPKAKLDVDINLNIRYSGPVNDEQSLGDRIRELRLKRNLSQRALADDVASRLEADKRRGFDFTYLSKIENNRLTPSAAVLVVISAVLETDSDELLALARKAPPDITRELADNEPARMFMRSALSKQLTEEDWKKLLRHLERTKK